MSKPQRSPIWRFFTAVNNEFATCNICKHKLSYKTTTTNLKRHMQSKHPTVSLDFNTMNRCLNNDQDEEDEPLAKVPKISPAASKLQRFVHHEAQASTCLDQSQPGTSRPITPSENRLPLDRRSSCDVTQVSRSQSTPSSKSGQFSQQQTLVQCLPKKLSVTQKAKTDEALLKLFTKDFQPFSVLEDEGFVAYSKAMNPSYVIPNRKTISKTVLPAKFEEVSQQVQSKIDKAISVCLTTDHWTSINTDSFVAVTAHFIDDSFELQSVLLQCEQFPGRHTSDNIAKALKELVNKWGINDKIVLAITDNASNVTKAITDLKWKHLGCFAHSLNLVVKDALNTDQNVVQLLEKIRKVVSHFKRSTNSTEKLMSYQQNSGSNPKKLVQDVPTRWNSTYFMLRRFILLQEPLKATMALIGQDLPVLTTAEWKIACELMVALKSFYSVTNTVSGENYATASLVIPLSLSLASICKKVQTKTFTQEAKKVVACLTEGVETRFGNVEYSQSLTLATFLDPRFKNVVFTSEHVGTGVKQRVVGMVSAITKDDESRSKNQCQDQSAEDLVNETQTNEDELCVWTDLDDILSKKKKKGTHYSRDIVEVDRYVEDDLLDRKGDPLVWWRENGHQYPNITKIAQKHFCCLATSVPCERAFSKAGMFVTERRNRLSTTKTKMLMFLNHNESPTLSASCSRAKRVRMKTQVYEDEENDVKKIVDAILSQ